MRSIEAINIVKNILRKYITDPFSYANANSRSGDQWIFSNEPHLTNRFPIIKLEKFDNPSQPISIGHDYIEHEQLYIYIRFACKNGFKIRPNNIEYTNAEVVEYYLSEIKQVLKSKFTELQDLGVGGYKHTNTSDISYDEDTQLYHGYVIIRVWYFNK